ncbi:uncharacterized protein EV420DRAFT_1264492 [Desarmillaria tabescens]|uniref:Mediator of RNA polymerase II transcription subunit 16 n=1 Tax=Armillaria tabescens TaxID=1929756 RepID=A0AA39NE28_ARMTA|nr:uncharacterized protein EV420DRAFT_1264492 [Desarmillaria tabescens]KAK0463953.1 hypothetical protein EV420DRAFT_1264492 [Desarmillaria tabescens]
MFAAKSPPKGKNKEEWHMGWWDFQPLVEKLTPRRAEWSNSSVIFTPHPTQPTILARHFSSSKQFNIPSPAPILAALTDFDPPTIISASPNDDWLFAYFPGRGVPGAGCLWFRGPEIDNWILKDYWTPPLGAGVVTASWLGAPREWTADEHGSFLRLPTRGPKTPVSYPTLALVTQNHQLTLCYVRNYIPSLKMFSTPLNQYSLVNENSSMPTPEATDNGGLLRLCVTAAIGLGYDGATPDTDQFDMNMSLDFGQSNAESTTHSEEIYGEESIIEVSEVRLQFDGIMMRLSTQPLLPIQNWESQLTNLVFVCKTPSAPELGVAQNETKAAMYLVASFLDFGDYSNLPQSKIVCYSMLRHATPDTKQSAWSCHQAGTRTYTDGVLGFLVPTKPLQGVDASLLVGILDTSGSFLAGKTKDKEVRIGMTTILEIPTLFEYDKEWEPSPIFTSATKVGKEVPIHAVLSPNEMLLCTVSSMVRATQTSVHTVPIRRASRAFKAGFPSILPLSSGLASAILSRRSTADFTHLLSLSTMPMEEVSHILFQVLTIVETQSRRKLGTLTWQTLGVALEIYRFVIQRLLRSLRAKDENARDNLNARWQTAHDLCSLAACNAAFEDCKDNDGPDFRAVWQFIGICGWVVNFIEKVMKEVMLINSTSKPSSETDDLFDAESPVSTDHYEVPCLLHIVHPRALVNLKQALSNVRSFRSSLGSITARGENSQIAKDVLVDLVDCSGVDLNALDPLLDEFILKSKDIEVEETRRSFASCEPTISMEPQLQANVRRLCESGVISKSRLYIKPHELIDGFENLSLEGPRKEQDKDVVSKGVLMKRQLCVQCLRCDGLSEAAKDAPRSAKDAQRSGASSSDRWRTWERKWVPGCVCGGSWLTAKT